MIRIRKAERGDIPLILEIILEAESTGYELTSYSKMFPLLHPKKLKEKIQLALDNDSESHSMGFKSYLLAEYNGKPAAGLSAYMEGEGGDSGQLTTGALMTAFSREEMRFAIGLMKEHADIHIPKTKGTVQIDCVATLPQYRGKGILKSLIQHVDKTYSLLSMEIQVWKKNSGAIQAYQKLGYSVFLQKISKNDPENGKLLMTK